MNDGIEPSEVFASDTSEEKIFLVGLFGYSIFSGFSISGSQISLGIAFLALLRRIKVGDVVPKSSLIEPSFACFALAGLFSLTNAEELSRGISEMTKFLIILVFWIPYWACLKRKIQQKLLGTMLVFSILSLIAAVIKMTYFSPHLDRASGFFSMPITFGECHALFSLTTLSWLSAGEPYWPVRIGLLGAFFLQVAALLISYTRGAWIGFALGFFVLLLQNPRRVLPIAVALVVFCFGAASISETVQERFQSFTAGKSSYMADNMKSEFRFRIWQIGLDIFQTKPVFGVGMNNIKHLYKQRVKALDIRRKEVHGHLHNNFMQYLVMTGLFGLVCFGWFLIQTGKFCLTMPTGISDPWQAAFSRHSLAIFVAFIGTGLTEYSFGDEEVAMLFFFLLGLFGSPFVKNQEGSEFPAEEKSPIEAA